MRSQLAAAVRHALASIAAEDDFEVPPGLMIEVERPRERSHGDWATNAALAAAKAAGRPPRELAERILERLPALPHVAGAEVAGPGFINFRLDRSWLYEVLAMTASADRPGSSDLGRGQRAQVEFVSANPNGPLHIGHGRGGVVGDALANLLAYAGYQVEREYYFNDAGVQIDQYAASLEARYLQALGRDASLPDDAYRGEYLAEWGRELADERGEALAGGSEDDRVEIRRWGLARAMRDIQETLELAGIHFDRQRNERDLHESGLVQRALEALHQHGYSYKEGGATWFRSSEFGDEKDRVLVKSDGTFTYLAPDVAYHREKFERGFDVLIDIWGADHHGYVDRLRAGVAALGFEPERLEILITQLVNVSRGGEPVRMSTRAGEFVTFREVLEEVGRDATRYHLVAFSPDTTVNFDLELARRQSMDNPVYYLQYAHARMRSLERYAVEQGVVRRPLAEAELTLLEHPAELDLLREMDRLEEEIEEAARRRAPHRLAAYGHELATAFHKFYADCRIVTDDDRLTQARLWLVEAAKRTLVAVLGVLGISAPEEM